MDSTLAGKVAKAKQYAEEPERVTFKSFEVEFKGNNSVHTVTFDHGKWHCSCDFFAQRGYCSHTMAMERLLGVMLEESVATGQTA